MDNIDYIIKRDGIKVPFDAFRIRRAIEKALVSTRQSESESLSITQNVCSRLQKFPGISTVEQCQDIVEEELMKSGYRTTAKAYILYREEHSKRRSYSISEKWKLQAREAASYFPNAYQYIVYLRTYAKWITDKNRRETWPETVTRFMNFMREIVQDKLDECEYAELEKAILHMEVMPSMRLLQFSGEATKRNNICAYNCSFIAPMRLSDFHDAMMVLMCGTGAGFSVESKYINKLPTIAKQTGEMLPSHTIEDSREGWCKAFLLGLETWYQGKDIQFDYSLIRSSGKRLKITGGRASGPAPLKDLLNFARELILNNQGCKLSTINVHDLMCKIGHIVVVGGVRRSSEISLSDLNDDAMRNAKSGAFWNTHPDRMMANNSAVYTKTPSDVELLTEWLALAQSGTGERGIFNRSCIADQLPERRIKLICELIADMGTNPCVTGDTWTMTSEGPMQVVDLVDNPINLIINDKEYQPLSNGFFSTGIKKVYNVELNNGMELKLTADHPFMQIKKGELIKTKLEDMKMGDGVLLSNHSNVTWTGRGTFEQGWLIGQIVGDGGIYKTPENKKNFAYCRFWGDSAKEMADIAMKYMKGCCKFRSNVKPVFNKQNKWYQVGCIDLLTMAYSFGMDSNKEFEPELEKTSYEFYRGFLRGFFDADGTIIGTLDKGYFVRLAQSNLHRLRVVQRMLSRMGIISNIYQNRRKEGFRMLPDSKRNDKEYYCKASHELSMGRINIVLFNQLVGFHEPHKSEKLSDIISVPRKRGFYRETFTSKIKSIEEIGCVNVYDVTVDDVHEFCANGVRVSNCGEIFLLPREFCNLTSAVLRENDDLDTLIRKVKLASILGTFQSMLTDFKNVSPEWKEFAELERLLGVSLNGQRDCRYLMNNLETLDILKSVAVGTNCEYADRFGINQSSAVTCVKPEGTSSQMLGTSSGIHARFAPYYIRRIRISATDPLAILLIDQGVPYSPENGQSADNVTTWVFEFPQKSPDGVVYARDLSALDQLNYWKEVKIRYTEHNPSCTIYVRNNEWIATANWLKENWSIVGGLSFLPYNDHIYQLAPYEELTKEEYEKREKEMPEIDFAKLIIFEKEDNTERKQQWACTGDKCELE